MRNRLIEFWRSHTGYGFHEEDRAYLDREELWDRTVARGEPDPDGRLLRRDLLAQPFFGNLAKARVFILYGNPGFEETDYEDEKEGGEYYEACHRRYRGEGDLFLLEDRFRDTGGGRYWGTVFKRLAGELREKCGLELEEVYQCIAGQVAIIEACAYHSRKSPGDWVDELPSSQVAKSYARDLYDRARNGEILLFIWRKARFWDLPERPGEDGFVIRRPPKQAMGRYLYGSEREAILRFLDCC